MALFPLFSIQQWVLRPTNVAPINLKISRGADCKICSHLPNFTFIGAKSGITAHETVKIRNFAMTLPEGRIICTIFMKISALVHVYR